MGQRRFEEAERELHAALECSPSLAEAYVLLGGICLSRGDLDGCLDYNRKAVQVRPGFSEGYGNIGFVELQRGNVDEAIKNFERATTFNFRYVQAFANLGNAYLMKGLVDEAIAANQKAVTLAPDFAPAHNNLAIAYLEKGEYALAVEHCDKAVALGYRRGAADPAGNRRAPVKAEMKGPEGRRGAGLGRRAAVCLFSRNRSTSRSRREQPLWRQPLPLSRHSASRAHLSAAAGSRPVGRGLFSGGAVVSRRSRAGGDRRAA
ncbi:MAG: tetratricopeptide repeat protein [Desulfobacterales bacterium]|nr:tetratricopeptide repeat protein [Desulfobacterales bacterium]